MANVVSEVSYECTMKNLIKSPDSKTVVFTNVCRIDGVLLSSYAVEAALDDGSPVYLQSDQGNIMLAKGEADNHIEETVPPQQGDYIFICDYNLQRKDVLTEYYNYKREKNILSNDVFAYYFDKEKRILCCTINEEAVKEYKDMEDYRKERMLPIFANTKLEINAKLLFSRICAWTHFGLSKYKIYINGRVMGEVAGSKDYLAIEPGKYEIKIQNMFGLERSNVIEVTIKEGECLKLIVDYNLLARIFWCWPYLLGIIPRLKTIKVEQV